MSAARIAAGSLHTFAATLLERGGLPLDAARTVADMLLWADLRGTHSHGVSRLPLYLGWLASGEINAAARISVALSLPALRVMEGDRCAGAVGMQAAARHAVELARASGVGMVLLRDTTHTGALGHTTAQVAAQGLVAISAAASGPHMAYHGAAGAGVSTAPLSIAAPGAPGAPPLVFDMASSAMALGKLMQAKAAGRPLPEGWASDAEGRPTTDPALATTPLPLGGPKGSGLALMAEVVASLLTHNPILAPALSGAQRPRHYQNAWLIAIDVAAVAGAQAYADDAGALVAAIKALPAAEGQQILLPGERGETEHTRSVAQGIALPPPVRRELEQLAQRHGLTPPWLA
jgi:LDH2 family malate/lactate/ureidoglycolate dehydrogenase